jgi:hypothetical protein
MPLVSMTREDAKQYRNVAGLQTHQLMDIRNEAQLILFDPALTD